MFSRISFSHRFTPISFTTLVLALTLSVIFLIGPLPSSGADPKKELHKIKEKLKAEKKKIEDTLKDEQSILAELEKIDKSVKKKKGELRLYDKRLALSQKNMRILKKEIAALDYKREDRRDVLMKRLRALYKDQFRGDTALILLSAKDYQDLLRKSRYVSLLAHYDSSLLNTYRGEIKKYYAQQKMIQDLQNDMGENKKNISRRMQEMQEERARKDKLLASVKNKRSSYEKMVRELRDSSDKLKKIIMVKERKTVPPSVTGKGFRVMRGKLPWPVQGKVLVPFGKYKDPKFNIPVFKNGIEIKANSGDVANAVHGGRAVYANWFKGYGQLLIINHGKGYHTLYGNLAEIFYKAGDIINKGSPIGTIGEKGILNVPILYFEIRHQGRPIDPLGWVKTNKSVKGKVTKQLRKKKLKRKVKKR